MWGRICRFLLLKAQRRGWYSLHLSWLNCWLVFFLLPTHQQPGPVHGYVARICVESTIYQEFGVSSVWRRRKKKRLSGFRLSLPLTPQPVTDEFELQEQDVWGPRLWCRAVTPFHCHLPVLLILSEIQNGSTAGPVLVWSVEEPKRQIAARLADRVLTRAEGLVCCLFWLCLFMNMVQQNWGKTRPRTKNCPVIA